MGIENFATHPYWCGNYDDSDFTSNDMCCSCGGGVEAAAHLPEGFKCMVHSGFRESYEGLVTTLFTQGCERGDLRVAVKTPRSRDCADYRRGRPFPLHE